MTGAPEAWTEAGRYLVLEPNPVAFEASWIDPGPALHSDASAQGFYVRKTFVTQHPETFRRVYVSADSYYQLFVNGRPVARGPARFDPMHQVYDTLDLSTVIQPGENVIAVQVMYWGLETREGPFFQCSARPAFMFESPEIKSDATWRVLISSAHVSPGKSSHRGGGAGSWYEQVDGRHLPAGFEQPGFEDASWDRARMISDIERWGEQCDTSSPWKLVPRTLPAMEEQPPRECALIQTGTVEGDSPKPPFAFDVKPESEIPSLPYTIPADGKTHYVVFAADRLVNGYPVLRMEGGAGETMEVMYAEAPAVEGSKNRRDALDGRRVEGSNDIYITRDGAQAFEPFLFRTFWYVRVAVRAQKPITVQGLSYRWTGYPFVERGKFQCSDPTLNRIWDIGWYTQRMCAYDTYEDCPYYERLQYGGDTRIQCLVTFYASGDARLAANAIRQIHASLIPEGLTQSRYPNHVFQVIPGYSLCWIMMLDDYYLHTGDASLVRECAAGVLSVLRFYENHLNENGFIANLPYWNFYDWNFEKGGVPDAHWENCTLSTMHFKGALDSGIRLFSALNDDLTVKRLAGLSERLVSTLNAKAWDEKAGLYRDGIAVDTLSKHVNAFAVLFDIADAAKKDRIAKRLFDDSALRETTFYFAHYLHEAASKLGQPQRFLKDLGRWKGMLDSGTATWWETPEFPRSECHAWSATPTYRLMTEVLGVRPLAPGFARVEIRPYPGELAWAEGTVPTPHGDIQVRWERGQEFVLHLTVPEGVFAEVTLPGSKAQTVGAGTHALRG